ncbi:MAG: hypothetical protein RIS53_243, partial [Bacillota bacterium]
KFAGFSSHQPWLPVHPQYRTINVEQDKIAKFSIQRFLKQWITIRKQHDVFINGSLTFRDFNHPSIYAYIRENNKETIMMISSFSSKPISLKIEDIHDWDVMISNHPSLTLKMVTKIPPYYGVVLKKRNIHAND